MYLNVKPSYSVWKETEKGILRQRKRNAFMNTYMQIVECYTTVPFTKLKIIYSQKRQTFLEQMLKNFQDNLFLNSFKIKCKPKSAVMKL